MAQLFPKPPRGMMFSPVRPPTAPAQEIDREGVQDFLNGDVQQARGLFQKAYKMNPTDVEAGRMSQRLNPEVKAIPSVASQAIYKQGLASFLSGDEEKAKMLWSHAYETDPNNTEALNGLQHLERKKGIALVPK